MLSGSWEPAAIGFFVGVENRKQIPENPEKFLKKIFFAQYLTFFQIYIIIFTEREMMRDGN